MNWLAVSIVASVVLTILLNLAIRLWPGGADRAARRADQWASEWSPPPAEDGRSGTRVFVPWKAMLVASVVLTVALNVVLVLLR